MMKLYLVRHGETDVNRILNHGVTGPMHSEPVTFKEGGNTDVPLNIYGRKHAEGATRALPGQIDQIYSSPLLRAKETAEIICGLKNIDLRSIIIRDELAEYRLGTLEGLSAEKAKDVAGRELGSGRLVNYDYTPWGGDSWEHIYDRTNTFLQYLKEKHQNQTIVCTTSAGIIRMTYKILFSETAPEIAKHINIPNGSVHEFVLEESPKG